MTHALDSRHLDRALRDSALAAVAWVTAIDSDVDVVVHDGTVTVLGSVRCIADRDRVLTAAMDSPGVQVVVDGLLVRSVHGPKATDAVVATQLRDLLVHMPSIHVEGVRVRVRRGIVTVSGVIPWRFERDTVMNLVGAVPGVEDVVDLLTVSRTDQPRAAAACSGSRA